MKTIWILALAAGAAALGWYGYKQGWFSAKKVVTNPEPAAPKPKTTATTAQEYLDLATSGVGSIRSIFGI